jgi:hypothetical protein
MYDARRPALREPGDADHGAAVVEQLDEVYEPVGEPGASADLGGCVNILTPSRPIAAKTHSIAPNSCLIEVKPWVAA